MCVYVLQPFIISHLILVQYAHFDAYVFWFHYNISVLTNISNVLGLEPHKTPGLFKFSSEYNISGEKSPVYCEAGVQTETSVRIFSASSGSTGYYALIFGGIIFALG